MSALTDIVIEPNKVDLDKLADKITQNLKRERVFRLEVGRDLAKAKAAMPHGEFGPWLKAKFSMGIRTAQRYIEYANDVDDLTIKHDIKYDTVSYLPAKAVCALATAPADVQDAIVSEIKAGSKPSGASVVSRASKSKGQSHKQNPFVANLPVQVGKIVAAPSGSSKYSPTRMAAAKNAVALLKNRLEPHELSSFEKLLVKAGAGAFGEALFGDDF